MTKPRPEPGIIFACKDPHGQYMRERDDDSKQIKALKEQLAAANKEIERLRGTLQNMNDCGCGYCQVATKKVLDQKGGGQ